jgi:hypothetical protein
MSWLYRVLIVTAALCLVFATACMNPVAAVPGSILGEMEDVKIAWDPSWEGKESRWALIRADFIVIDEGDALPLNNVIIEIGSSYSEVYVLPTSAISVELCEGEGDVCQPYTDDPNQTWAQFIGEFNDQVKPNYYKGYTDAQGVETVWLWVEDMPLGEDEVLDVQVWATIGVDSIEFTISG